MNADFSPEAKKNIGYTIDDMYLFNLPNRQIEFLRETLDLIIQKKLEPQKVSCDQWRYDFMVFGSGLFIPMVKKISSEQ